MKELQILRARIQEILEAPDLMDYDRWDKGYKAGLRQALLEIAEQEAEGCRACH